MVTMKDFFNAKAAGWDQAHAHNPEVLEAVIEQANIGKESRVLDVGCGTGIMFDYYANAGAAQVIGLDMSDEMVRIANQKWVDNPNYRAICADVATWAPENGEVFDAIVFFNVWPHIMDVPATVAHCAELLKANGRVVIAHGKSRQHINEHHAHVPTEITRELLPAQTEAQAWTSLFTVVETLDADDRYRIVLAKN